jgi:hypothetical protein
LLSTWLLPSGATVQRGNLIAHETVSRPLEIWARWDSEWYLMIASDGYVGDDRYAGLPYESRAAAGFLPLYPLLIRALTPLFGPVGSGVLISNICLAIALVLLYRLVYLEVGVERGESAAMAACAALLVHPSSLFLSAVYAESLFLALSLAVFLCARRRRFALAGIFAGLATLTRPFGVLLVIPIFWEWWAENRGDLENENPQKTYTWSAIWAFTVPIALGTYMFFCHSVFGDPLAFVHRQARWRGTLSGPWRAFVRWWESGPTAHGAHGSTVELVFAFVCLAMLVFMMRRLRGSYTLYVGFGVVMALGTTLWSFSRLTLTLFPLFMLIGVAWAEGRRYLPVFYGFLGATLAGLFMALFANWWWVG